MNNHQLEISIVNLDLENIIDVDIAFVSYNSQPKNLNYDGQRKIYYLATVPETSRFTINAFHPAYEPQIQEFVDEEKPIRLELVLQQAKENIKLPKPIQNYNPFVIGIIPSREARTNHQGVIEFDKLMETLGLVRGVDSLFIKSDKKEKIFGKRSSPIYLFSKADGTAFSKTNSPILEQLRNHRLIAAAGPTEHNSVIGNQLLLSFSKDKEKEVLELLKQYEIVLMGGTYGRPVIAEAVPGIGTEIFEIMETLKDSGLFNSVQVNSASILIYKG